MAKTASHTKNLNKPLKLGDLMVKEGLLTHEGLSRALMAQQQQGQYRPLGQLCVDLKLITKQDLQRFLSRHHKRIQIGELLLNMGLISQAQLNHVLEQQRITSLRFGTLLVRSGIITEVQLTEALSMQLDIPRIVPSPELIDLSLLEGVEEDFLRRHACLPVHRHGNQMAVVMADPLNSDLLQALIDKFKCKIMPAIAPETEILTTLSTIFKARSQTRRNGSGKSSGGNNPFQSLEENLANLSTQARHTKEQMTPIANFLIRTAVEAGATAVHLESQERYLRVRYRLDGVLQHRTDLPVRMGPPLIDCIKTPFRIKREDYWRARILTNYGQRKVELSISYFQGLWGENMVLHINYIPPRLRGLENLSLSPLNYGRLARLLDGSGGVLLAASPLRGGKSTMLYAAINHLNHLNRSILTLEDMVDYPIPGVIQHQFPPDSKDAYPALIQAMIDYDSDVVMVGEVKNREVTQMLNQAALVGRKALGAIDACDTTAALHRLLDLEAASFLTTPVPLALLAQRLVRKLCDSCRRPHQPEESELRRLHLLTADRGHYGFWQPIGCQDCNHQGYLGMTALHEVLEIGPSLREGIRRGLNAADLRELARGEGRLISLAEDGVYKAMQGQTSLEEVQRVAVMYESDALSARSLRELELLCGGTA